ncbi:MAG TPA: c-type cytochrome [Actinomycetota bacterium]|nr:c-type cytochrome [Actinomycetota bacterium]
MRRLGALLVLSAVPTLLIVGPRAGGQISAANAGPELFATGCASCHGVTGEGTANGPPLVGVGPASVDFMLSTGRMPLADPTQQPTRQSPKYTGDQIDALVAYVTSLGPGGEPIPVVDPEAGELMEGRDVYSFGCLACHGAGGQGASVGGGQLAPTLDRATPEQVAEAVRIGPGAMPPFTEGLIDQQELDSLVRYVFELREAPDPGGFDLGRVGPVTEGFVAWVLGLGILLLVIRLTGTRT